MRKKRLLPNIIHVRYESPGNEEPFLVASENGVYGALDDDGPVHVGEYELVKVFKAEKVIKCEEVK